MNNRQLLKQAVNGIFIAGGPKIKEQISETKDGESVYYRALICLYLRLCGYGIVKIGKVIGKNHSTVLYLLNSYESKSAQDFYYRDNYIKVKGILEKQILKIKTDEDKRVRIIELKKMIDILQKELNKLEK